MRLRTLFVTTSFALAVGACRSSDGTVQPSPTSQDSATAAATPETPDADAAGAPLEAASLAGPTTVADPQQGQGGSTLDDASRREEIRRQQRDALLGEYLRIGDERLDQSDFEGALTAYSQALDIDPGSDEARERMRRVQALMGDEFAGAADYLDDLSVRESVRRAQARIAAESAIDAGNAALADGDYEGAIGQYREAQLILRYHPLIATDSLDEERVTGLLNRAIDLQEEALADEAEQREAQARAARAERERAESEYVENQMRTLYNEANRAYMRDNFKRAEALANQILLLDKHNAQAMKLRDNARLQRHKQTDRRLRQEHREQWNRTFDELDMMDTPQVVALEFDDLKRWSQVRERKPLEFAGSDDAADADREAVLERLDSTRFAPAFVGPDGEGTDISDIANYLQNLTGVNFIVSTLVREDLDEEETTIKLQLNDRSVRKVLDIIADTSENLRWKIEDGVVKFVTKEELVGGQRLKMYEVRDIIHPVPDFPGREINVSPSGGLEAFDEDFDEREGLVVTADTLETLIRDNIAVDSWDEDPQNAIRIADNGTLVVNQTPEVHGQIESLLDDLREAAGIMVDIQANFLSVEDNFLEDIGIDFRGLGQPGLGTNEFLNDFGDQTAQQDLGDTIGQDTDLGAFLDEGEDGDIRARTENLYDQTLGDEDILTGAGGVSFSWTYLNDLELELVLRAVSKSERLELVTAPRILVFNTARANITVLNQIAYVQDFDVEIAQGASIADPIIDVIQDGVILDVRPVVSADRRFILMELRPTVAELQRPILEQPTSLGNQTTVTLQLPEVDIQRVRTTIPMPDGGTVMLGGLKISEKKDQRSGIPFLNKIPVLSFFFDRKGTFISNRKLLILITAQIVIPEEHEPTPSQLGLSAR